MFILLVNMVGHISSYLVNLEKNLLFPRYYSQKCLTVKGIFTGKIQQFKCNNFHLFQQKQYYFQL